MSPLRSSSPLSWRAWLIFTALILAACSPSRTSSPVPSTNTTPASSSLKDAALAQVNAARAQARNCGSKAYAASKALAWNTKLEAAAKAHNQDMLANNFFDHTGSDGSTPVIRAERTGYAWTAIGENIAAGQDTLEVAMRGWLGSPGHCANIMNPNFTEFGLGALKGNGSSTFDWYWTMDFGRPR